MRNAVVIESDSWGMDFPIPKSLIQEVVECSLSESCCWFVV